MLGRLRRPYSNWKARRSHDLASFVCLMDLRCPPMGDHLWQSTLFLALAAILAFALRKNQARVRYWVWLTASVKFLIPFSLLIALGSHLAKPRVSTPAQVIVYSAVEDFSQPFAGQEMPVIYHSAPTAAGEPVSSASTDRRRSVACGNRRRPSQCGRQAGFGFR
jgi:hypothetical protein